MVFIFIFIIPYCYYYFILFYFASLPFSMANHLGLDELNYQMVEEWDVICECSAPVEHQVTSGK